MKHRFRLLLVALAVGGMAGVTYGAQSAASNYSRVADQRAEKIVAALALDDAAKAARVREIVAAQYGYLRELHAERDVRLATARAKLSDASDKSALERELSALRAATKAKVDERHAVFLRELSSELTPAQIEAVKDGMTYGVLPLTFRVYQDMLPDLTAEQKAQIHTWLVEARELAMDAGTSEEKHAVFGKFKGRINNYLTAAGYNMKQSERDLGSRRKTADAGRNEQP